MTSFKHTHQYTLSKPTFKQQSVKVIREIAMVMIGILLALQVNNWAEAFKERKEELRLLNNFQGNLEADIAQIDSITKLTEASILNAHAIIDILNDPSEGSLPKFIDLQLSLLFNEYFITNDGAYSEASSTGKIELLENVSIREHIFQYYRLAGTTTNDDVVFKTSSEITTPVWKDMVGSTREMTLELIGRDLKSAPKLVLKDIARNRQYISMLVAKIAGGGVQIRAWETRRIEAKRLKDLLTEELKRWE
ncbi:DUF6090 family protein [Roseivirga sp. E12]|uniref:DUF6090 family protein n=1 Tax=Roseivirga sp. E12 TaxID=2819237 RepID=UPI001ABC7FEC|nr:DUF6090 family protein [Roseivirga sp. E12]MBO3700249.1 hypothetical protein [Roseivirga sp. E12]